MFDNLLINYPDDIEARAHHWLEILATSRASGEEIKPLYRYALDRVLQEVLAIDPDHVGALHYRIHTWDYSHNLDYLCYIQEQLGTYQAALVGASQLASAPPSQAISPFLDFSNLTTVRVLVKFEKWEQILQNETLINNRGLIDGVLLAYARSHALLGLGRFEEAEEQIKQFEAKAGIFKLPQEIGKLISRFSGNSTQICTYPDPFLLDSLACH